jgi:translation elongation factor EF-G
MCTTLNLGTMTVLGWGKSSLLQYSFPASQSMIAVTHPTNSTQRANIDTSGPNLVTDVTKGISNLQEVKDSFNAAWQWATKEGVMCDENMRGIRYNLQDITPRVSTPFY